MINDIYNSSISTYQHIPHNNYEICRYNLNMFAFIFGWVYGRYIIGALLWSIYEDYKQLKAHKWHT
jgi:hypothetical protein